MKLSYKDELDKCYGATGMAIGIVVLDGEDMIYGVNLDAEPLDVVEYTEDFYFSGNPSVSAKVSWNKMLQNFNISMGATIANVLCRSLLLEHAVPPKNIHDELRSLAVSEGTDTCALEADEIEHIFDKNYSYLTRIFSHRGVQSVANDFATALQASRRLSRLEVLEHLRALSML